MLEAAFVAPTGLDVVQMGVLKAMRAAQEGRPGRNTRGMRAPSLPAIAGRAPAGPHPGECTSGSHSRLYCRDEHPLVSAPGRLEAAGPAGPRGHCLHREQPRGETPRVRVEGAGVLLEPTWGAPDPDPAHRSSPASVSPWGPYLVGAAKAVPWGPQQRAELQQP